MLVIYQKDRELLQRLHMVNSVNVSLTIDIITPSAIDDPIFCDLSIM